jgi:hypothetical protein
MYATCGYMMLIQNENIFIFVLAKLRIHHLCIIIVIKGMITAKSCTIIRKKDDVEIPFM